MRDTIIPTLERLSCKKAGSDFGVAYYPEFLRESTAVSDYDNPGTLVFGIGDAKTESLLSELCAGLPLGPTRLDITTAEFVKYANNAWHALKVSFANEIGNICSAAGVDGRQVLSVLCSDRRLNISPAYLKPGFAFGGSCLPKDLRALRYRSRLLDVPTPVLDAVLQANENQLERAYRMVAATGRRNVGLIGLSFKPGTDDLRESPAVELVERLHGRGFNVKVYDSHVQLPRLTGTNREYVRARLPHIATMLQLSIDDVLNHSEVLVLCDAVEARLHMCKIKEGTIVIDLVRVDGERRTGDDYRGICW
jgi:GDP-mannose 6-dehydrogenase